MHLSQPATRYSNHQHLFLALPKKLRSRAARLSSLDGRRAHPMLLRNGVCPRRGRWHHCEPSLRKLAALDPIGLHACPTTRLAGLGVGPLERKAEPRPVAFERMIVHNDAYIRPLRLDLGDFLRVRV